MKRMRGALWRNPKYKGREYRGTYEWSRNEREFILVCTSKTHNVSFESAQMAKDLGWRKA
jgi:hypothetical protein